MVEGVDKLLEIGTPYKRQERDILFALKVQTAMRGQGKESHSKADFQGQDFTHDFLEEARQLGVFKATNGSQQMADQLWLISHTSFPTPRSTCVCLC